MGTAYLTTVDLAGEWCHRTSMTDKASPAGWVVQVSPTPKPLTLRQGQGWAQPNAAASPPRYFEVAIADAEKALQAVRKHSANDASDDMDVRAVRALSSSEIAALKLKAGDVKPA